MDSETSDRYMQGLLDDQSLYPSIDVSGLRDRLFRLPGQCIEAWSKTKLLQVNIDSREIKNVVIIGMGGSAIAGDLLIDMASAQKTVPISVVRDFSLPMKIDSSTLVVACSYSGQTEETLALYDEAASYGAKFLVIGSGGALVSKAESKNEMILTVDLASEPRSAVAYSLVLLLGALSRLGIISVDGDDVRDSIAFLTATVNGLKEDVSYETNLAKQLATNCLSKSPVIYGGGIFTGMARRWKTQINENSKSWAFYETIPELLHNSIEAYASDHNDEKFIILLRPSIGDDRLLSRYDILEKMLSEYEIPFKTIEGDSHSMLSQILNMLALGDYVSYYLALVRGVDPAPNPVINRAKSFNE